jgi:response regulator RpfG family c-di-GMP phosphodiesterase
MARVRIARLGEIAAMLAAAAGLAPDEVHRLRLANSLHDLGESALSPEPETSRPPSMAARPQAPSARPVLQLAVAIARQQHEHWDGSGTPRGLAGADINVAARITALADFVDATVFAGVPSEASTLEHALAKAQGESGKRFDPALVAQLAPHAGELRAIYQRPPPN